MTPVVLLVGQGEVHPVVGAGDSEQTTLAWFYFGKYEFISMIK